MEKLPKATHKGILKVGDVNIKCYVLEDGRRVLSGRTVTTSLGLSGRGQGAKRITDSKSLKPFISDKLTIAIEEPIVFKGAALTHGYEAWVLPEICQAVLNARDRGVLPTHQMRMAAQADILIRAFATVGIIALVDEVTGYQAERDRDELQKFLSLYLSEERLKWAKMFPDEYYRQLFRLRGWNYSPLSVKRPKLVGKLTNELVYKKLPPPVLDKLRELNPVKNKQTWRRGAAFFQYLSEDIGQPDLRDHLLQLIAIMRISPNWSVFQRHFARAFPSPEGEQTALFDETEDDK
ncbi:P63C domain-containing protein [Phosphitispora fastidiosa]|uniref:P63C domain-containing protein n=1 Tax=Phosphitispora fastidiosa TaxID=2837202 RepID=UPI001E4F1DF8|nr:hypothetical protein [Phosphitispora fastidiosa]